MRWLAPKLITCKIGWRASSGSLTGAWLAIAVCLCLLVLGTGYCEAAANYQLVKLGAFFPNGINNNGAVVGYGYFQTSNAAAVLWRNGTIEKSYAPGGGLFSYGYDVNDSDVAVGYGDSYTPQRGFAWKADSRTLLSTLGGIYSYAYGINNNRWIVGSAYTAEKYLRACLWVNGQIQELYAPGHIDPYAADINDSNWIVGTSSGLDGMTKRALLWRNGSVTDLGTLGGKSAQANAIGASGHIVGYSTTSDGKAHAFLYYNDLMTDLSVSPTEYSQALGVNRFGQAVGFCGGRAFIWNNGQAVDLNSQIDVAGWTLSSAVDINDSGQITGLGRAADGQTYAFLLTPVPEPSALLTLLTGIGSLSGLAWCRRRSTH